MKPETLISVSATVIALASLWVSFTESRSIRSHHRQSVRPLLQIRRVLNFEGTRTGIQLFNAGLGRPSSSRPSCGWTARWSVSGI